jgi:hypothetical protein
MQCVRCLVSWCGEWRLLLHSCHALRKQSKASKRHAHVHCALVQFHGITCMPVMPHPAAIILLTRSAAFRHHMLYLVLLALLSRCFLPCLPFLPICFFLQAAPAARHNKPSGRPGAPV